jgi:signal transduction histidine kinase
MAGHRSVGPRGESVLRHVDWRQPLQQVFATATQTQAYRLLPFAGLIYILVLASSTPDSGGFAHLSVIPIVQAFLAVAVAGVFLIVIATSSEPTAEAQPPSLERDTIDQSTQINAAVTTTAATQPANTPITNVQPQTPRLTTANLRPVSSHTAYAWADLMSQVSHELRTPLNAVIGFSDVMNAELHGPLENPKYREYLAHIRDSGRHLLKSTEDTLAMTSLLAGHQGESRQLTHFHIDEISAEAWSFVAASADERGISLGLQTTAEAEVLVRHRPLRQTLINLFSAALSLADDETEITLRAETDADVVQIVIGVEAAATAKAGDGAALPVAIASALCDLQDTDLLTERRQDGTWSATLTLQRAAQPDFFSSTSAEEPHQYALIN